jgi:hypothetical protein
MALNPDRVGHRYPSYQYEISREKVREYALVIGAEDGSCQSDEGDLPVPSTFAACFTVSRGLAPMLSDDELGAHPSVLHASQEYDFHRPIKVGDVLRCTPWITAIRSRRGLDFLTVQIDCLDR